jgi:hypothetical protein
MTIVVKPHSLIKPLIARWRHSLSDDPHQRDELSRLYWSELERRVQEAQGNPPPGSINDDSTIPPTFWCELRGGVWVQLVTRPDRRVRLFSVVREVVVINLVTHRPD